MKTTHKKNIYYHEPEQGLPNGAAPLCIFRLERDKYANIPDLYQPPYSSYLEMYKVFLQKLKVGGQIVNRTEVQLREPGSAKQYGLIHSIKLDAVQQSIEVSVEVETDQDVWYIAENSGKIRMIPKLIECDGTVQIEAMDLYYIDQSYSVLSYKDTEQTNVSVEFSADIPKNDVIDRTAKKVMEKIKEEESMSKNIIIGVGNCGTQIAKAFVKSAKFDPDDTIVYAIDSTTSSAADAKNINFIPIVSDEKEGSGRDRERGRAMYLFHESEHAFDKMYQDAEVSKAPIIVITSGAGGTGSGTVVPICKKFSENGLQVIPYIVCPNIDDPIAYHLNTNDLLLDLDEAGILTYSIFTNSKNDADYVPINQEVVDSIEIILGKHYDETPLDSIDPSDLDVVLNTPGRFVAVKVNAETLPTLQKELAQRVFSGFQPGWSMEEAEKSTFMTAYSLRSMFASNDFKDAFAEVNKRIVNVFDEYRNIVEAPFDKKMCASLIVAGLPRHHVKKIDSEYKEVASIGSGMGRSTRPSFMNKKKASVSSAKTADGNALQKFNWK